MEDPVAAPEPAAAEPKPGSKAAAHRADATQAFMAGWLPQHGVSASAFTASDAEALLAAIAAAGKAAA